MNSAMIPWAFVLVAEAPDSSGVMRLAAKAERKKEFKDRNRYAKTKTKKQTQIPQTTDYYD